MPKNNNQHQSIHFITYSNNAFKKSKQQLCKEIQQSTWFDTITSYSPNDLDSNFSKKYNHVLKQPRIGGYGIWRPYIIKQKLLEMNDNDILIYLDAGCAINEQGKQRFNEYISMLNENDNNNNINNKIPLISFQLNHPEKYWTTSHIFEYFNIGLDNHILNSGQILDGILIMKKTTGVISMIDDWYNVIEDDVLLFTDNYNNKNQMSYFKDNRHEQSIFSIIRKLGNTIVLNDETYFKPFNKSNKEAMKYPFWAMRRKL
jgi:hypothetical protein